MKIETENSMELHKLLKRQLMRTGLTEEECCSDPLKWREFLDRINRAYQEADQERYLLERSMEISSREMGQLNQQLEAAQGIAHLGYWYHDINTGEDTWSKELYTIFGLDHTLQAPSLDKVMTMIHEKDRDHFKELIDTALITGKDYEIEFRMKSFDGKEKYRWFLSICHPIRGKDGAIRQLTGIAMDITQRKHIEKEVDLLHQQLLITARSSGMAEVATSILHNVGNVLNSANVALGLIQENVSLPYFKKLFETEKLLDAHLNKLNQFLTEDPKGELIIQYLCEIIKKIKDVHSALIIETANLREHLQHIKDITAMQKSLSGVAALIEKTNLPDLIDNAIRMSDTKFKKNGIALKKHYKQKTQIMTDKSKVLQILINLIQNARDALLHGTSGHKKEIAITLEQSKNSLVNIIVSDTGIGIPGENLTKIFSMGFTTKEKGHGFGLHSSALAAKDLGGSLKAVSAGVGQGATFILTLPLNAPTRGITNEHKEYHENFDNR